jgi:competence protein ComGC
MIIQKQKGFALIAIVIVIALILALFAYFLKPGGEKESVVQTGKNAKDQLEDSNKKMQNYQGQLEKNIEVQNNLNSIQ